MPQPIRGQGDYLVFDFFWSAGKHNFVEDFLGGQTVAGQSETKKCEKLTTDNGQLTMDNVWSQ